jgi:hypothetical protein
MSETIASHSEDTPQDEHQTAVSDAFSAFGLDTPSDQSESSESQQDTLKAEESETPVIENAAPAKTIKVKVDKEEREFDVSEDKLPEYVQKAYALDKVRGKQTELERNLDRAAKLHGFNSSDEYLANLDHLEQQAQQRQQDQFKELRDQLREEAEYAGIDAVKLDAFLDNHPLLQEANRAITESQRAAQERNEQLSEQQMKSKWSELYSAHPDLVESSRSFDDGIAPEWFTSEMQSLVNDKGYDPLHAYKLAHMDKLQAQTKKQAEQKAIKDQRLGLRSQVETEAYADSEPEVSPELASAFALFGLNPKSAQKYAKK